MFNKIMKELNQKDKELEDVDGKMYQAIKCRPLLTEVMYGATNSAYEYMLNCFIGDCDTLNAVIRRWVMQGYVPMNNYHSAYISYTDGYFNAALAIILTHYSNIHTGVICRSRDKEIDESEIARYTERLPESCLRSLVERIIYDYNFGQSEPFTIKGSVGDWFAYCAKQGWLSFDPYIHTEPGCVMLVFKYNRLICFNNGRWGIYTSNRLNSYWYKGVQLADDVWHNENIRFANALMWAGLMSVGCRMSEFNRLLEDNPVMIDDFVDLSMKFWGISKCDDIPADIFMGCFKYTDDVIQMGYRLVKDENSEYARMSLEDRWHGAIEIPNGIEPQTIRFDFTKLALTSGDSSTISLGLMQKHVVRVLLCGLFAMAGVLLDDKTVYAVNRDAVMRAGTVGELVSINTVNDIPGYAG